MDFTLNDEQRMFSETSRAVFADTCGPEQWRRQLEGGEARDTARWNAIVDTGFTQMLLPGTLGGLGLSEFDFVLVAEQAGYAALPDPLIESAGVAAPLLAELVPTHPALKDPSATVAIQHPSNPFVLDADTAAVIVLHREGSAYLANPEQVRLVRETSIDPFRRLFRVDWSPADAQLVGAANWELAFDRGALFAAAQGLGLAQRSIDLAVAYAKERQQFGKAIGSYQAIKHHLASAQVAVEFARPVVHAAAAAVAHRDVHSEARVSHAKIVALEAADQAARAAIQVHGAMGYSWEVDIHLFLKRALALTHAWGAPGFHRSRIARRMFTRPLGPDQTFARETDYA